MCKSATKIGSYIYDAWGNPISTGSSAILQNNPLRYRGYIYDTETGFYYLQSRYYDPVMCRFINADDYVSTGTGFTGYNMFAYCNNNPVMLSDPSGTISEMAMAAIIGGIVGVLSGVILSAALYPIDNETFTWRSFGAEVAGGAISGLITGTTSGVISVGAKSVKGALWAYFVTGAVGSFVGSVAENSIKGESNILVNGFVDAVFGAIGGLTGGLISGPAVGTAGGSAAARILKKPIVRAIKLTCNEICEGVFEDLLKGFTDWLAEKGLYFFVECVEETFE